VEAQNGPRIGLSAYGGKRSYPQYQYSIITVHKSASKIFLIPFSMTTPCFRYFLVLARVVFEIPVAAIIPA
jgi:hypothetical protein